MRKHEIIDEIIQIASSSFDKNAPIVAPLSSLKNDLELNSLETIELIMDVEKKFKVTFKNSEITKLETVLDISDLVCQKLKIL